MGNICVKQSAVALAASPEDSLPRPALAAAASHAPARLSGQSVERGRLANVDHADPVRTSQSVATGSSAPAIPADRFASHRAQTAAGLALQYSKHRSLTQAGVFHELNVRFKTPGGELIPPKTQAISILRTAKALIEDGGAPGVAITCSTNTHQTHSVFEQYATGKWDAAIRHGNQGCVIAEMEELQRHDSDYSALKGKVRVAPISTVDCNSPPLASDEFDAVILNDLDRINVDYLKKGWVVLGWRNQTTAHDAKHPYAVGSGPSGRVTHAIGERQSGLIQGTLIKYSQRFAMQGGESQAPAPANANISASPGKVPSVRLSHRNTAVRDVDDVARIRSRHLPVPPAAAAHTGHVGRAAGRTASPSPAQQSIVRDPIPAELARRVAQHRTHTPAGVFHGFKLPFADASGAMIEARAQAKSILEMAKALIEDGQAPGVAITYSANTLQTEKIRRRYASGVWRTGTTGFNQAQVVAELERLQREPKHAALQGRVRIAPISTIDYHAPPLSPAEFDNVLRDDLTRIRTDYLDRGWVVLGWQNQLTADDQQHPYAVGGGVARTSPNAISDDQSNRIQKALVQYAQSFALQPAAASENA